MKKTHILGAIGLFAVIFWGCEKDRGINLFTKQQDVEFGLQMRDQIDSSAEFNVLDSHDYPEAYNHINRIMNTILNNASDIKNKDVFNWEVFIINEDVLNAFACPGGYMYFYTGLIKYLENESQLAGVMAHEMAHVELRHSTRQMTDYYGYAFLIDLLLNDSDSNVIGSIVNDVATGLTQLAFSRKFEYQADEYAVKFLSDTDYDPLGVAGFFEKLEAEEQATGEVPVFLRTHPSPEDRIEKIHEHWEEEGSKTGNEYTQRYLEFKNSLPQ